MKRGECLPVVSERDGLAYGALHAVGELLVVVWLLHAHPHPCFFAIGEGGQRFPSSLPCGRGVSPSWQFSASRETHSAQLGIDLGAPRA